MTAQRTLAMAAGFESIRSRRGEPSSWRRWRSLFHGASSSRRSRAAAPPRRSISESIALAEARSKELGYEPVMDAEFAADMEEIIRNRKPRDISAWD